MRKKIIFGENSATFYTAEDRAWISVHASVLPVRLADVIDQYDDVTVTDVILYDRYAAIILVYDVTQEQLLENVVDAIAQVYKSDMTISDAGAEIFV